MRFLLLNLALRLIWASDRIELSSRNQLFCSFPLRSKDSSPCAIRFFWISTSFLFRSKNCFTLLRVYSLSAIQPSQLSLSLLVLTDWVTTSRADFSYEFSRLFQTLHKGSVRQNLLGTLETACTPRSQYPIKYFWGILERQFLLPYRLITDQSFPKGLESWENLCCFRPCPVILT